MLRLRDTLFMRLLGRRSRRLRSRLAYEVLFALVPPASRR